MESPRKNLMKHIWRFQQVGGIVSVALMCLNLTIPLYNEYGWFLVNLGIPENLDWLLILIYFAFTFSLALIFGILYDKVLKLWRFHQIVAVERNPFQKGKINPNEMVNWQYTIIPLLLKNGLKEEAIFNLKWNEQNMERDPALREEVYRIIDWISKYKLKDMDDRWLAEMSEITKRKYKVKYNKIKPDW
jgi:uncharacterized membrane protein YraQ (UPF0718 family)